MDICAASCFLVRVRLGYTVSHEPLLLAFTVICGNNPHWPLLGTDGYRVHLPTSSGELVLLQPPLCMRVAGGSDAYSYTLVDAG